MTTTPTTKQCSCGRTFRVIDEPEWKFAGLCDACILARHDYWTSNPLEQREDARLDMIEESRNEVMK